MDSNLDTHHFKEGIQNDTQINSYILHVAHVLNEVVHRQITINERKLKAV